MHCAGHLSGARLGARHWSTREVNGNRCRVRFFGKNPFLADQHSAVYDVAARCAPALALRAPSGAHRTASFLYKFQRARSETKPWLNCYVNQTPPNLSGF